MVRIATLNARNTADGWRRRRSLLVRQLVDLDPDVIGLQELRTIPNQARSITRHAQRLVPFEPERAYRRHRAFKTGYRGLWEGIGVVSRLPVVERATLDLAAQYRVAIRVTVRLPEGHLLEIYNTHLASVGEPLRLAQAERLLAWMDTRPGPHKVLMGDLNSRPGSPTIDLISARMRSAHFVVHRCEPDRTAPTPLRRNYTGTGAVLDYIFVSESLDVRAARVAFDQVDPDDCYLCASDHYGLTAEVAVREP